MESEEWETCRMKGKRNPEDDLPQPHRCVIDLPLARYAGQSSWNSCPDALGQLRLGLWVAVSWNNHPQSVRPSSCHLSWFYSFFSFLFFSHLDSHWILKTKLKQSLCIIKGMLMQQLLVSIRNKHFYFSICRCRCFLNTATPVGELLTTRLQEQASFAECVTRAAATWGGRNFKPSLHYSFPPVASEHGNGEHRDYECVDANSWSITLEWLSSWPQFVQGRCQEP